MLFPEDEATQPGRSRGLLAGVMVLALGVVAGGVWWWSRAGETGEAPPQTAQRPTATADDAARPAPPAARPEPNEAPARPRRRTEPAEAPPSSPAPEAPAARGVLRVQSDVEGASVFLDRTFLGTTPLEKTGLTPGSHRVNVSAEGYDGVAQTVEIGDTPAEISVKFREVRLDASAAVVHKHGVGSCDGRLVATVQGLRYETSNRGDAFDAPFSRLQAFEVDYLKKNLRVRLAGGKTWNFTDPSGNADALFVFHRDVEKARARLGAR